MPRTFLNLSQHLLVAIDCETTGLTEESEIIQVSAIPLDSSLNPTANHLDLVIRPSTLDGLPPKVQRAASQAHKLGMDPEEAVNVFIRWYNNLHMVEWGRIVPLGHNYLRFDEGFIRRWLGDFTYDFYFHSMVRDTLVIGGWLNDFDDYHARTPMFPDLKLPTMARVLGIDFDSQSLHNSLYDANLTAQVYKAIMKLGDTKL